MSAVYFLFGSYSSLCFSIGYRGSISEASLWKADERVFCLTFCRWRYHSCRFACNDVCTQGVLISDIVEVQKHGNRKRVVFIDAEQAAADATGGSISDLQVDALRRQGFQCQGQYVGSPRPKLSGMQGHWSSS